VPAVAVRHPLHMLTGAEPLPALPSVKSLPGLRPVGLFRPSLAGLKALRAADVVIAADITDPQRCWMCKGFDVAGDTMPDGEPVVIVVVDLDMDTTELAWLIAAANELITPAPSRPMRN